MLALFALPARRRLSRSTLFSAAFIGLAALPRVALAADALPVGSLDARATGSVSSASTSAAGSFRSTIQVDTSESVINTGAELGRDDEALADRQKILRDAHQASVLLGASLTRGIELSLGLHGTYEHVRPEDRLALDPEMATPAGGDGGNQADGATAQRRVKESGFAGASLLVKFKLLDSDGFRFAIAPFIESGAGEQATYSLTRSVGPKAGFMGLLSYGALGVGSLDLEAGARYRDPEAIAGVTLRNEIFYKALVQAELSRDFSVFVGAEGRKLKMAIEAEKDPSGKEFYRAYEAAEAKAGFTAHIGESELGAYYGARLKGATGFGYGQRMAGLTIGVELGKVRGRARPSFADEIEKTEDAKASSVAAANPPKAPAAKAPTSDGLEDYPEMRGTEIDPIEGLGANDVADDDFAQVKKDVAAHETKAGELSEDAKIENELAAVREAKKSADAVQEKREAQALLEQRQEAMKRAKEQDKMMEDWMKDAKAKADELPGVTQDEIDWNGLN